MKTKPISIRFEENDLKLAQELSGIEKPQKLVDLLIHEYVKHLKKPPIELPKNYMAEKSTSTKPSSIFVPVDWSGVDHKKAMENVVRSFQKTEDVPHEEISSTPKNPPKTYDQLLKMAKEGVENLDEFMQEVKESKVTPGQKAMILSKIDQKN